MPKKKCKICGRKIVMMSQIGTDYCCDNCRKRDAGEPVADD